MSFKIFLIKKLPDNISLKLIKSSLDQFFNKESRRVIAENIRLILPASSPAQRSKINNELIEKIASLGLSYFRSPKIDSTRVKKLYKITEQRDRLTKIKESKEGVGSLVVCTHFDALEYLIHLPLFKFRSIHTLAKGFGFDKFDKWFRSVNLKNKRKIYEGEDAYVEITKRLCSGLDILVICDQNVNPRKLSFGDFYGVPACSSRIITLCSIQTKCSIVMASVDKTDEGKIEFNLEQILNPNDIDGSEDKKIKDVSRSIHTSYVKKVKKDPLSWFWLHRLWKIKNNKKAENIF